MLVEEISKEFPAFIWSGYLGICPVCGEILISLIPNDKNPHIDHNIVQCKCKSVMIDGSDEYVRYGGNIVKLGKVTKRNKYEIVTQNETIYCRNLKSLKNNFKRKFKEEGNSLKNITINVIT